MARAGQALDNLELAQDSARQAKMDWVMKNSRSEPHLGYDFLRQVPADFEPPAGAPERKLWASKGRNPLPLPNSQVRALDVAAPPP